MITTVDEFLAEAYKREILGRATLTASELADMTKLVSASDMKARLATLKGIPKERCFISATHRDFLTRALAAR